MGLIGAQREPGCWLESAAHMWLNGSAGDSTKHESAVAACSARSRAAQASRSRSTAASSAEVGCMSRSRPWLRVRSPAMPSCCIPRGAARGNAAARHRACEAPTGGDRTLRAGRLARDAGAADRSRRSTFAVHRRHARTDRSARNRRRRDRRLDHRRRCNVPRPHRQGPRSATRGWTQLAGRRPPGAAWHTQEPRACALSP